MSRLVIKPNDIAKPYKGAPNQYTELLLQQIGSKYHPALVSRWAAWARDTVTASQTARKWSWYSVDESLQPQLLREEGLAEKIRGELVMTMKLKKLLCAAYPSLRVHI